MCIHFLGVVGKILEWRVSVELYGSCKTTQKWLSILHSHQQSVLFVPCLLPTLDAISLFNFSHSCGLAALALCDFNFRIPADVEHFFLVFIVMPNDVEHLS